MLRESISCKSWRRDISNACNKSICLFLPWFFAKIIIWFILRYRKACKNYLHGNIIETNSFMHAKAVNCLWKLHSTPIAYCIVSELFFKSQTIMIGLSKLLIAQNRQLPYLFAWSEISSLLWGRPHYSNHDAAPRCVRNVLILVCDNSLLYTHLKRK